MRWPKVSATKPPDRSAAARDFPLEGILCRVRPSARRSNRPCNTSSTCSSSSKSRIRRSGFPITAQQQLGQILFMPPNVAGWDWGQAWINTNTLLTRYNLAGFLTKGSADCRQRDGRGTHQNSRHGPRPKNAGRGWNGPDYQKIAPRPLREHPAELVDALIFRFFQGHPPRQGPRFVHRIRHREKRRHLHQPGNRRALPPHAQHPLLPTLLTLFPLPSPAYRP